MKVCISIYFLQHLRNVIINIKVQSSLIGPMFLFLFFANFFYFPVGRLTNAARRLYSDVYPKITTHYTVYPRDKDPRWKGE